MTAIGDVGKPRRRRKREKEKRKPRRPMSSYLHFLADFRQEYKKLNPMEKKSPIEAAQAGAVRWRQMAAAEKEPYEKMAQDSRVCFISSKEVTHRSLFLFMTQ